MLARSLQIFYNNKFIIMLVSAYQLKIRILYEVIRIKFRSYYLPILDLLDLPNQYMLSITQR